MEIFTRRTPFALARRNFVTRGLIGGNRTWLVLGGIVYTGRLLRKATTKRAQIVLTERLVPGQPIRLEAIPATSRRARRRARS